MRFSILDLLFHMASFLIFNTRAIKRDRVRFRSQNKVTARI